MPCIWEKAISILAGNLNSGRTYLITAVIGFSFGKYHFAKTCLNKLLNYLANILNGPKEFPVQILGAQMSTRYVI